MNNNLLISSSSPSRAVGLSTLVAAGLLALSAPAAWADPGQDNRAPDVPTTIAVPDGNKVSFHASAVGVQIYVATPSPADSTKLVWTFRAPEAVLFDSNGNVVGIHYAGPTWE